MPEAIARLNTALEGHSDGTHTRSPTFTHVT